MSIFLNVLVRARNASLLAAFPLLASTTLFAESVYPPLALLADPRSMVVVGTVVELNPAGRLVFARKKVLSRQGAAPDQIDVRVPATALTTVKLGEDYLFAYTSYTRDPRRSDSVLANPDGSVMINSPGLEPALFRNTQELRALLEVGRDTKDRGSRQLLKLLMKALVGHDSQLQNLAAAELALDPEVSERLQTRERKVIETMVRNGRAPPAVRASLLHAAAAQPVYFGSWWRDAALQIVATTPVAPPGDSPSDNSGLVLLSLDLLQQHSVTVPPESLKRWTWSATPSVAEHALVLLRRASPEQERPTILQALSDPALSKQTHAFLIDHLRRLDFLYVKSASRKGESL